MNIIKALTDPRVLGFVFAGDSWRVWRAILAGAFGLPLSREAAADFRRLTDREPLKAPCRELLVLAGRRGGKSIIAAAIAVFLATLKRWTIAPGEVGVVMVLATDRDQARVAFRYCLGLLEASPVLSQEVESATTDTIRLKSGIEIIIGTSDRAAVRGRTILAAILDELAFWGADADEVLRALRPGMASQPEAILIQVTTAYSQRGPTYETFKRYFGTDSPRTLVVRATTRDLNAGISQEFIDAELAHDPQAAASEYLAQFRSDLEALLDMALIDRAVRTEPRELPRMLVTATGASLQYFSAVDVSGGRNDATAAAVTHCDADRVVVDACRRWPAPHDPVAVAAEVATFLKSYGATNPYADQYGAELSRSIYAEAGLSLMAAEVNRSEAYLHMLPLFTSGRVEIPDEPTLRAELLGLERRTGRSGKDAVDHRVGQHDDLANSTAIACWAAARNRVSTESACAVVRSSINDGLENLSQDRGGRLSLLEGGFDRMLQRWSQ